jgi:electron transport complex protein RnfA
MFMKKSFPPLYKALGIYLPLITTNCAVLGVALLNVQSGYGFVQSTLYGFFAALGFTFALFVFAGVRQRLELASPPESFAGVPLSLIAAGLIAMAFSGFKGVSLGGSSLFPFTMS